MLKIKQQHKSRILKDIRIILLMSFIILGFILYKRSKRISGYTEVSVIDITGSNNLFNVKPYFREFPVSSTYYKTIELSIKQKEKEEKYKNDPRVKNIEALYRKYNSPLESKAQFIVETADYYQIDYRLVPAISIVESGGGVSTYRPYNAWGWGGQSYAYTFKSWEEAIIVVTKGLKKGYWDKGAQTPYQIGPYYNPESWQSWAAKVDYIMSQL